MKFKEFVKGQHVSYRHHTGYINFIDEQYVTITIHEYPKHPDIALHSKHKTNQTNLVVSYIDYDLIQRTTPLCEDNI